MSTPSDRTPPLTLAEFIQQLHEMRRMIPLAEVLKMLPETHREMAAEFDEPRFGRDLKILEEVLGAMTPEERLDSQSELTETRRREIADRAGIPFNEVNLLLEQFYQARRFDSDHDPGSP